MAIAASPLHPHFFTPAPQFNLRSAAAFVRVPASRSRFVAATEASSVSCSRKRCSAQLGSGSPEPSSSDSTPAQSVQIDLNLPRRKLRAEFTCNACGARTQRLINPHAYKKGTVYVQCSGCEVYHQLVDNLKVVVEYRFDAEDEAS